MTIGDRVRLAGPEDIDGWVVPTPPYGTGTWVRWDRNETGEADQASLELIDAGIPSRRERLPERRR